MARAHAKLEGLAAIDRSINTIRSNLENLNGRIQETAVAIVEHAAGKGNGDVSRSLLLVQAVSKHRSVNTNYLIGWFAYFASTNINLKAATAKLFAKDSKKQRGFDVEGAKANNWFDAVDDEGNRAAWYQGPTPETYTPGGIGDVADSIHNFVKRTVERLDNTKTVGGKEVPLFELSKEDREQLDNALAFMDRLSATLARKERVAELTAAREAAIAEANQDVEVLNVITPQEEAVA